jgi:hypothetical protein
MISCRAVGAQPTTQTAPGPTSPNASRIAAAARVMPAVRDSRWVSGSLILQTTGMLVMPAATISTSATTGAPAASAATQAVRASSSHTRSVA